VFFMTAIELKEKTECYLLALGIPINLGLPPIEEQDDFIFRTAEEIAGRTIILAYLGVYSEGHDSQEIIDFFKSEDLWNSVSEHEKELLLKNKLTKQDRINLSWRSEGMYLLLWVIRKIDQLVLPTKQCDIGNMLDLLPGFLTSPKEFISNASIRSNKELLDHSDLIYRLHWATREAQLKGEKKPADLEEEIIQEWHYAINWLTYYDDDWDDIPTDT